MDDNKNAVTAAAPDQERDRELFDAIGKGKKKRRVRRLIITLVILALVGGGIASAVIYGRSKVREQVSGRATAQVATYTVNTGSVNTTVSGSGMLSDVDTEKLTLPENVKVEKVLVSPGQRVEQGELLATVDSSSVLKALSETQTKLNELDGKLRGASNEAVSSNINTGVAGRVKAVYAQKDDDVAACMIEHGALALLSLDGYMAADVTTDALAPGDAVTILRAEGKPLPGSVERVNMGVATVLVTDNGPMLDETVTVQDVDGNEVGTGVLYVHNPLKITGYAGTISWVNAAENKFINAGNNLFTLKDTAFTANYESILKERREQEDKLVELLAVYRAGAVEAPFAGTVSSIEYKDPAADSAGDENQQNDPYGAYAMDYNSYAAYAGVGNTDTQNTDNTPKGDTALLTLSPDERMSLTISVDETGILALEVGQNAQVTVNSLGEMFTGEVTEINRSATGSAGVTSYSAVITMPKDPRMLSGMSARAVVLIQGVSGAVLIPEEALHQTRDSAFVYTEYDYETREFGGVKAVVPGLSDGSMVEIVEGLNEGDTVYYAVVFNPWAYYGSNGNASGGDAWVEMGTSDGDAAYYASEGDAMYYASEGDAQAAPEGGGEG